MSLEFHYCRGTPPNEDFEAVQLINTFDDKALESLTDCALNALKRNILKDKLHEQIVMLASKSSISEKEFIKNFQSLKNILEGFLSKKISKDIVIKDLMMLGLKEKFSNIIAEKLDENLELLQIFPHVANRLVDVQWKFGITVSSSEVNKMSNTFIDLNLVVDDGTSKQKIFFELTLPQFYNFLHELEIAKNMLEQQRDSL